MSSDTMPLHIVQIVVMAVLTTEATLGIAYSGIVRVSQDPEILLIALGWTYIPHNHPLSEYPGI